jgi:hypothetical protein
MTITRDELVQLFAMTIARDELIQIFAMTIIRDELAQIFDLTFSRIRYPKSSCDKNFEFETSNYCKRVYLKFHLTLT